MTRSNRIPPTCIFWLAILVVACGSEKGSDPSETATGTETGRKSNVLVLCVDVLRADHVGTWGYATNTTPSIDRLSRSSVIFQDATSAASWTKPSVPSYFTGRYPHQHGLYEGSREVEGALVSDTLAEEETTFAEMYRRAGFRTAAFVHNAQINGELGFDQGFERYEDDAGDARDIADRFLRWVDELDGAPFVSYLHFLDVHWPYDPPGVYREVFEPVPTEIDFDTPAWRVLKRNIRDGDIRLSESDRQTMIDLYDGELRYTDDWIGRIFEGLRDRGLFDETMIVFLSDHGEEFLEHGKIGHGNSLYEELLHVPLIVRFPRGEHGARLVEKPVSLVDLLPTLADFSGLPLPDGISGRSLLPLLEDGVTRAAAPLYAEGVHGSVYQQTIRLGRWKYIASVEIDRDDPDDEEDELREDLARGLRVEVEGVWVGEGDFLAEEVEVQENQEDDRDKVTGPIEELAPDGTWIRVLGYRVELLDGADIENENDEEIDFSDLALDTMVKVYGRATSATGFEAEKIKLRDPSRRRKIKLEGPIAGQIRRDGKEIVFFLAGRAVRADSQADFAREITGSESPEGEREIVDPGYEDPWASALAAGAKVREELYDLVADPREQRDLAPERPGEIETLREALGARRIASPARKQSGKVLSDEELEALRAMGYIK
jgi:arylsulfatase